MSSLSLFLLGSLISKYLKEEDVGTIGMGIMQNLTVPLLMHLNYSGPLTVPLNTFPWIFYLWIFF